MNKYRLVGSGTISLHFEVEAGSLGEAIEKAKDAPIMGLCYQCSRADQEMWVTSGELDCDVTYSKLSEAYCNDEDITDQANSRWGGASNE